MVLGYIEDFIGNGIVIPLPRLTPAIESLSTYSIGRNSTFKLDYIHYSVIMNKQTKQPLVTAFNLDQSKFQMTSRGDNWKRDSRIRDEDQLENHYYKHNDWDKGHMVMRNNTAWGDTKHEAQLADEESFYYTNAAFQHKNMNRDEWLSLEENIERKFTEDSNNRLCVFTGPIHSDLDRFYARTWHDTVRIPSAFYKIICYQNKDTAVVNPNGLGTKAFIMFQDDEILKDMRGRRSIKFKEYQVTIKEIQDMTGLDFGKEIFDSNPLFYTGTRKRMNNYNIKLFPERVPIDNVDNIVDHEEMRLEVNYYDRKELAIISALIDAKGKERDNEWVVVMNNSNKKLDINGCFLFDSKGRGLELKGILEAGKSLKIEGKKLGPIRLANTGGDLRIINQQFKIVDYVRWSKADVKNTGAGNAIIFGYTI